MLETNTHIDPHIISAAQESDLENIHGAEFVAAFLDRSNDHAVQRLMEFLPRDPKKLPRLFVQDASAEHFRHQVKYDVAETSKLDPELEDALLSDIHHMVKIYHSLTGFDRICVSLNTVTPQEALAAKPRIFHRDGPLVAMRMVMTYFGGATQYLGPVDRYHFDRKEINLADDEYDPADVKQVKPGHAALFKADGYRSIDPKVRQFHHRSPPTIDDPRYVLIINHDMRPGQTKPRQFPVLEKRKNAFMKRAAGKGPNHG